MYHQRLAKAVGYWHARRLDVALIACHNVDASKGAKVAPRGRKSPPIDRIRMKQDKPADGRQADKVTCLKIGNTLVQGGSHATDRQVVGSP